jgi:hypothetical protein
MTTRGLVRGAATIALLGAVGAGGAVAGSAPEDAAAAQWERVVPGGDCQCADGGEFSFYARTPETAPVDPSKVLLFFEGGGACWDAAGCAFTATESTTYDWDLGPEEHPANHGGVFDLDNPDNAEQVVVAGASAGSIATPYYGALVADALPGAGVVVLGDGSGGYPDIPGVNALIGNAWGTMNAVPDWPETAEVTVETWSIPSLWVYAGRHAPDIVMARYDYAFDATQVFFAGLAGIDAEHLVDFMDGNEAAIEAAGVEQLSYTAPGDGHTLTLDDELYTMEVDGVRLVDWVAALLAGETVDDVHCTDCAAPAQ